jgi:Penicillin-Binding Protein C-terminus Family
MYHNTVQQATSSAARYRFACSSRAAAGRRSLFFNPDGPGFVRLTVMDARGSADSVLVRLQ